MKRVSNVFVITAVLLFLAVFLSENLLAGYEGADKPSKAEVMQKTKKLQMPFIANNGQMDKRVKFYANTFGGTVFVTKEGEIGYSLKRLKDGPKTSRVTKFETRKPRLET